VLGRRDERLRAAHGAHLHRQVVLHRPGEGEQPVVLEELPVEGDGALVEQRADHLDTLDGPRERLGLGPVDLVLGEQAEVPAAQDHLAPAPGQLVERRG
jgi:hypothetical protein